MANALETTNNYWALVAKAVDIVNKWPWIRDTPASGNNYWPRALSISDGKATLTWMEDGSYDSGSFSNVFSFPAEMLEWTEAQLMQWRVEEEIRLQRHSEEESAEYARRREAEEAATYLALKAKYEKR